MKLFSLRTAQLLTLTGVISASAFLSGCATSVAAPAAPVVDQQLVQLTEAANKVSTQLDRLIRLERGVPEKGIETAGTVSPLKTVLTVKWSGTGEDLAKGVAEQLGFRFVRSGSAPFTPVIVPLDGQDRTAEVVLRAVADRMAQVAEVRVSEKQKLIEIAYRRP